MLYIYKINTITHTFTFFPNTNFYMDGRSRVCSIDEVRLSCGIFFLSVWIETEKRQQMTDKYHHWMEKNVFITVFSKE